MRRRQLDAGERQGEQPQPRRIRQDLEQRHAKETVRPRTLVMLLDGGARVLDERRVAHAGRAGGFAGHASEARVEMTRRTVSLMATRPSTPARIR